MIMIIYHDDDDCDDDAYDVIMNLILFALAFCADSSIASIMTASKERVAMCRRRRVEAFGPHNVEPTPEAR